MNGWDWGDIHVLTGEWWLFTITLAMLLIGLALGYALGAARERRRCEERHAPGLWDEQPGPGAHQL